MTGRPDPPNHGLAAFLLGRATPPEGTPTLRPFAYTTLPADHPARPDYRPDYLRSIARHFSIKAEVAPLIAAWRDAGIEALLWKGFYLAEFVYPTPGMRFHGDVDVLLRPRNLARAARIARALGWAGGPDTLGRPASHQVAYELVRPGGATLLDVHRYVLHRPAPGTTRQKRATRALWDRSVEVEWEGTAVRLPHPVDAALICLFLHRAWGSDRWGLKPHDFLDLRYLIEREGISRTALESRAAELGCSRTLARMLERCDPWTGRFEPGPAPAAEAGRLDVRTLPEHVPYRLEQSFGRSLRAPGRIRDTLWALPHVLHVRRALRRQPDLRRLLAEITPPMPARRCAPRRRRGLVAGAFHAAVLFQDPGIGVCVTRSLAIYRALRRQGWPVEFVSGVRRDANGLIGHAWVELDGEILPELHEWQSPRTYCVNFRFPLTDG